MGEIYSLEIMEIAGSAPLSARLINPDARVKRVSRVCGSTIEVDLIVVAGVVTEYAQKTNACVLGQASAAILATHIVGTSTNELRDLRHDMEAMLKQGATPPTGKWYELKHLQSVSEYPQRHASTMLVFNAVVECLDAIEAQGK